MSVKQVASYHFTGMLSLAPITTLSLLGVGSLAATQAIVVPFSGALIRIRAHYSPKGLQLDPEDGDGVQPHTRPVIVSIFFMLARVYRIEGWQGLYKGLMPALLGILITIPTSLLLLFLGDISLLHGIYNPPTLGPFTGILAVLAYGLLVVTIFLPLTIIGTRAVTTPHKLPYFNASYALRVLLSPTERRRPWILYLTPGLLVAAVLQVTYIVLGLGMVRSLVAGAAQPKQLPLAIIYIVLVLASPLILTPLQVMSTRLAVQRNHAAPKSDLISQEESGAEEAVEYAGADEDVISLRTDGEPYTGLLNCAKTIISEEGYSALYRAWWWTVLGLLFSS